MAAEKGAPLDEAERAILEERARVGRTWLEALRAGALPGRGPGRAARGRGGADRGAADHARGARHGGRRRAAPGSGDAWQDLIFRTAPGHGVSSGDAFAAMYARSSVVPTGHAPAGCWRASTTRSSSSACAMRPARPRGPRRASRSRDPTSERRGAATARGCRDRSAQGAIAKGEDPALVDAALALDCAAPRGARPGGRAARRAQGAQRADRRGHQGRRRARRARRWRTLRGRVHGAGRPDHGAGRRVGEVAGRARGPAAPDPQPARPGRPGRRRGGERHRAHLGRAAGPTPTADGVGPQAALGGRRGAGPDRPRRRRQDRRLRLPRLPRRRRRAPARPHRLLPRPPHPRARHDRDLAAGGRERRVRPRHRPDPGQGRPDVRRHARRAVPGADRGGPGHQHPPRRDHRGGPAAHPLRRLLALLPARGGRGRRQDARASCASTSSTRSRWSASSGRTTPARRSSG